MMVIGMHASDFFPLVVWLAVIFAAPQAVKKLARTYNFRDARWLDITLPLLPVLVGAATACLVPYQIGLDRLVDGERIAYGYAALIGCTAGAWTSVLYKIVLEVVPESWRSALAQIDDEGAQ